ncbi:glycosyltransferase family 2 protein [Bdellovibrio sp. HCB-110]|uniref:glycosyltransferase family 2 protein n=1 Tax=Bdellovibrio sp. HCB-110 TaxID=3391182 RepID=UPI0039B4194B
MTTLSIVIPVFNKHHLTDRCLDSLLQHSSSPHQITIIDNNSTDETPTILNEWKKKFEAARWIFNIVVNEKNVGFGRAMNQGAKLSSGEYLCLLNNDTWLLPNWDLNLSKALDTHPELQLVFPYIDETHPFDKATLIQKGTRFEQKNRERQRHTFTGVLMFFRKSAFDQLQGFDERFFVCYEDTDLRVRMDKEDLKYRMVGSCFIWHHSMGTRSDTKNIVSTYEQESRAKFFEKWGFNFSDVEKTLQARWERRWTRFKNRFGYL